MFEWTQEACAGAGYSCYELSNFAKPGQSCRHNEEYWRGRDYVGIGPGAASHRAGLRSTNLRPLEAYEKAVRQSGCAAAEAEVLSPSQQNREAIWLALRTREGFDPGAIEERTGCALSDALVDQIDASVAAGDLEAFENRLRVPREKMIFTDTIAQRFL